MHCSPGPSGSSSVCTKADILKVQQFESIGGILFKAFSRTWPVFSLGFFFKIGTITAVNRWTLQKTAVNSKVDFPTTKKQRDLAAADDTPPRGAGGGEGHGMAWQLHPCQHGGHQTISPKEKRASEDRGGNADHTSSDPIRCRTGANRSFVQQSVLQRLRGIHVENVFYAYSRLSVSQITKSESRSSGKHTNKEACL